jgi:hypothetical protein
MNPNKFSVYTMGPNGLEAILNKGWQPDDHYLRRFPTDSALYVAIIGEKRLLTVVNREDQKILNREGVLAAPILDKNTGTIFGMLKVEQLDMEELNITNIESFRLICESAGLAYSHALTFQKMARNSIEDLYYGVASPQMMVRGGKYLTHLAQTLKFPLASIRMSLDEMVIGKDRMIHAVHELEKLTKIIFGPLSRFYLGRGTVFILHVPLTTPSTLTFSLDLLKQQVQKTLPLQAIHFVTDWYYLPETLEKSD